MDRLIWHRSGRVYRSECGRFLVVRGEGKYRWLASDSMVPGWSRAAKTLHEAKQLCEARAR